VCVSEPEIYFTLWLSGWQSCFVFGRSKSENSIGVDDDDDNNNNNNNKPLLFFWIKAS
jgi:hypothetical protein